MSMQIVGRGMAGIQGSFFGGTGFHRRNVIYGLTFDDHANIKGF